MQVNAEIISLSHIMRIVLKKYSDKYIANVALL